MKIIQTHSLSQREYDLILSVLNAGGVIGFPTDTAYGLGVDPFNEVAVDRIFTIKGRLEQKPILLLVDSVAMAERVARPTPVFYELANRFWPGPLTMIVPARSGLPAGVTAGTGTVGLRLPNASFPLDLIHRFDKPVTATSANRSGKTACVTASEVVDQLGNTLDVLVDGGKLPERGGSSILDLTAEPPVLLREGPIGYEMLQTSLGDRIRRPTA